MSEEILFDADWLKLKKTQHGFIFSERKGVNSTATLLYKLKDPDEILSEDDIHILVRYQPMPFNNEDDTEVYPCPITGGLEEGESPIENALKEVYEEAGYKLDPCDIFSVGDYYVGTQTNEKVHMFIANVSDYDEPTLEPKGDGYFFEKQSYNRWENIYCGINAKYSGLVILSHKVMEEIEEDY